MDWDYADLLEHAPDAFLSVDTTGTVAHCNATAERMTGYTKAEIIGRPVSDLYDPECLPQVRDALTRFLETGALHNVELRIRRRDGSLLDVGLSATAVRDTGGRIVASRSTWRDISSRKRAESALRASEERYRTLFAVNPQPMWVYDIETLRFLEVNAAAIRLYGYTRDEFLARTIADIRPAAEVPRLLAALEDGAPRMSVTGQWHHVLKSGAVIDVEIHSHALRFDGRRARLVQVHDVTEQRRAEAARLESEVRLQTLVDHAPAALAMFDRDMRYLAVSRRWIADYGLDPGAVIGRSHYDVFPDIPAAWKLVHQRGLSGEVIQTDDDRFDRADGTTQWLRWEVRPWRDATGEIAGIVIFTEDITARKRAEASLAESEERLRLALDAAHMGTYDWNVTTGEIVWSRWHEELWGYRPGAFDGTYAAFQSRIHPDDRESISSEVERSMATRTQYAQEYRVVWPDGSVHWIAGVGEFTFAGDRPIRMRGVVVETTARKEAEAQLARSQEALAALTARLERMREEERTRISREIHDELGQMLTAVKLDLRWLERQIDSLDARDTGPLLDRVVETGALVDASAQAVQRIAADLRPGLLDRVGLGAALLYETTRFSERTGIVCDVIVPNDEPHLPNDVATALFRVAQEALTNVARHAEATAVEVRLAHGQAECRLSVADNGRGLPADAPTERSLGLLGMRERVRGVAGTLTIERRRAGGTEVRVVVPAGADRTPS